MSQVLSINRVFLHKLHHPPCCLGNFADWGRQFYEDDRDTWSQSQNEEGPSPLTLQSDFRRILAQPSSLKHQQRSDTMVPFRAYEISFLFLLLVKFHGSGKSEMYAPVQRILQFFFLPSAILSLDTETATLYFESDVRPNDFRTLRWLSTVFVFQNFDMMLEFQSRDKWSLNNYDAIEIKSKGFYASSVTIPYDQNLRSKLKLRSTLFSWLVWVVFLAMRKATALSGGFPLQTWWLCKPGKELPSVHKLSPLPSITHYWFK